MNLKKYRRLFYGKTLCNDSKAEELKSVGILNKFLTLRCSWIRKLHNNQFHEWNCSHST